MGTHISTPEMIDAIVAGIEDGVPLRKLCRDWGISKSAWYDWVKADADLAGRVARARDIGFTALAEECLEIADNTQHDTIETEAGEKANAEWISRSKLRVETRLKLLACWDPKRYGSKVDVAHSGGVKFIPMQPGDDDL